jgi:hypothetical protein
MPMGGRITSYLEGSTIPFVNEEKKDQPEKAIAIYTPPVRIGVYFFLHSYGQHVREHPDAFADRRLCSIAGS